MTIGVLKEPIGEHRVSVLPEQASALSGKGVDVWVEAGAGVGAYSGDDSYMAAGAKVASRAAIIQQEVLLSIHLPAMAEAPLLRDKILIGYYQPLYHPDDMQTLARGGTTIFSLDMMPRTTRAQSMDILSSQASIAGYQAVLLAASMLPRYFPMLMTAAGSIAPARVLILGAGVAGLQAVATARRLGAVVEVFDTRPQVKEEVLSLGARFVEVEGAADASKAGGYAVVQTETFIERQKDRIAEAASKSDVIITTAQIPGKPAPVLITTDMLDRMKAGSVIIDLAAATGGNTDRTIDGQTETYKDIRIVGNSALAAGMPMDASRLYGKNVSQFLSLLMDNGGQWMVDFADDLVKGCCITHGGAVIHERIIPLTL